ncbi:type IV secretion system protein VirB10 [Agrobacterium larrymoorei]|uniref:Type IV secretion system protein VirB10 n=1 Tax=Agrobacterium larrymoorei TaxID=160699 RepID=A0AAJ2B982_9HYPH|nr:TrbI/VirB10 family protein [Agrobacterium larrymoorei]MDR6101881.1 type IV secretion system protein VirB10 [Agrobacterium larrymoorei]
MTSDNQPDDKAHLQQEEEMRLAAEREVLLDERRTRQTGSPKGVKRAKVMAMAIIGGATFLLIVVAGPSGALKLLGVIGGDERQTSSVDMEVDREKNAQTKLDFVVPGSPEAKKEEPVDPNLAWNQRFKDMQDKLLEMERRKPEISVSEIRNMLSSYNETVTRRLEEERKAMAAENARLREEAQRAEDERRRAEEEAKQRALSSKERAEIDKAQRESDSVIVDEGDKAGGIQAQGADGELAADLDKNERFLKSAASSVVQTSVSQKLIDPSRMIVQGAIISAVLETAIDTQLPGNIKAQVMRPVYSFDGSRVLMPPGTMLIGQFNNDVDLAQKRVLIAWNRAVTPEGKSIAIGSTGTDTLGRAGTLGNVDNRYGTKFGAAILISAISAIPSALSSRTSGSSSGSSGTTVNIGDQAASNAGSDISDQANGVMEQYLSLPPIIRIPQGEEIRVFVNRDLVFR